ncbi:unnamed protein product, partial [Didymodactylos carnosus]
NFVAGKYELNEKLPSIETILMVRYFMGYRIYQYSQQAAAYLEPILNGLRFNDSTKDITIKQLSDSKR